MGAITPQLIKELREKTGAGFTDCKNALEAANGDLQAAIEYLRQRGAVLAAKRADRVAREGVVLAATSPDGSKAVLLELNCETDFVARNAEFIHFAHEIVRVLLEKAVNSQDELWSSDIGGKTLGNLRDEMVAKVGEKIHLRRYHVLATDAFFTSYVHAGSRLAAVVEVLPSQPPEELRPLLRDLAMQVAAMQPEYVRREEVPAELYERELQLHRQQALSEGKPPEVAEQIARGRLEKFLQERCLLEQAYIREPNQTVGDVITGAGQRLGIPIEVRRFWRYFLG
ncbi:MAG: translation elongation factor Ts, partial [Candidatus Kapabacteria bacterium]|nr:translation elongation factor Ts [Candidatus Kapabacteria bacterium]MDW7997179.1 translation elongation factor Ts [Bacteroidota bacterium]